MSSNLTDDQVEIALRAWARHSIDTAPAQALSLSGAERHRAAHEHAHRRRLLPALAAAAVLVLAGAGLALQHFDDHRPATALGAPVCPRHAPVDVSPSLRPADGTPLFDQPVATMTACSYTRPTSTGTRLVAAVSLGHHLSTQLAHHLNNASTISDDPDQCLALLSFSVLVARDDHGTQLAPVTLLPGCRQVAATNGTTTRYIDVSDPVLRQALERVTNRKPPR